MDERDQIIAELRAENAQLKARVAELEEKLRQQSALIEDLYQKLGLNSQNSSLPPSADRPAAAPKKEPKTKSGRKQGAQPGHVGKNRPLQPPEKVTRFEDHKPTECHDCGESLEGSDPSPYRHQVTEVPKVEPTLVEHRLHCLQCKACGARTRAALPPGVPNRAFGPRLAAFIGVLSGGYRMSKRQIGELLYDFFGVDICLGSIKALETDISKALAPSVEQAKAYVKAQEVSNLDETGWRHEKKRAWLWVALAGLVSVFVIRASRASKVAKELLGESYKGTVGSDRWSAYTWLEALQRQICWSHLKRDFAKMAERLSEDARIGEDLEKQREALFKLWYRVRDGTLARSSFRTLVSPIRQEIRGLLVEGSKSSDRKIASLSRGILKDEPSLWTFVRVEGVEPTNNGAERAIRFSVIWRKTSFGTESDDGRLFVERMLTVGGSLRLQGRNVLDFVTEAFQSALIGKPSPSLLPTIAN